MKTKTFLLLCLFLGIGLTQLSAQNGPKDVKTVVWDNPYYIGEFLYCDGAYVGYMEGPMVWHLVGHFINGVEVWEIAHAHGTIQSSWGEVFTVKEVNKEFIPKDGYIIGSTNLNGNWGDHFIFRMTFDKDWNIVSIQKEGCPVNKK
jgi:hypothetical protein